MPQLQLLLALLGSFGPVAGSAAAQEPLRIKEDKPGLLAKAKVRPEEAELTALAKIPAGKLVSGEIEMEKGRLVYSFDIKTVGKRGIDEVTVDALTGVLIGVEHETGARAARAKPAPKPKPPVR